MLERRGSKFVDARRFGGFAAPPANATFDSNSRWGLGYRQMCLFMSLLWFEALAGSDYAMRVDEDVCIERISPSAFELLHTG